MGVGQKVQLVSAAGQVGTFILTMLVRISHHATYFAKVVEEAAAASSSLAAWAAEEKRTLSSSPSSSCSSSAARWLLRPGPRTETRTSTPDARVGTMLLFPPDTPSANQRLVLIPGPRTQCYLCLADIPEEPWNDRSHRRNCAAQNAAELASFPEPYPVHCPKCGSTLKQWPAKGGKVSSSVSQRVFL